MQLRQLMARTRPSWWLWLSLLTIPYTAAFAVQILWDAVRQVRATWHWQYKYEWRTWFGYFGDKNRTSMFTLGARPAPTGGTYMRNGDRLQ